MLKFTAKQLKNQPFATLIRKFLSDSGRERIETCGRFLEMLADATLEKKKLHKGSFCGNRFCPMRLAQGQERRSQNQRYYEMARN